jgi:hypothetical protein
MARPPLHHDVRVTIEGEVYDLTVEAASRNVALVLAGITIGRQLDHEPRPGDRIEVRI